MDMLHGLTTLVVLAVVLKWYSWAQMCYGSSYDEVNSEPVVENGVEMENPKSAEGKDGRLGFPRMNVVHSVWVKMQGIRR